MIARAALPIVVLLASLTMLACRRDHAGASVRPAPAPAARAPVAVDPLADFVSLLRREPRHVGAHYIAARVAARSGDSARALGFLTRLADLGLGDELEPDDFPGVRDGAPYRALAQRFAAAAPAVGAARMWTETACADFLPEGTAWDAKRSELLLSSGRLRTVVAVRSDGGCREVVPRADTGLLAVLGMVVDAPHDALWVASTAAPFMLDATGVPAQSSLLARIDLARGRVVAVYPLPGGGMLNDLALAPNGDVYVTDSINGTVLRLGRDDKTLRPIVAKASFEGPNGIAMLATGELVVADFHGLWQVSASTTDAPTIHRLTAPDDQYLGGFDGLARVGDELVGIQNLVGRGRIWRLAINPREHRANRVTLLLRGHADLLNPTTGAWNGEHFLFVADPKLQQALPAGLSGLPAGRTGHRVLAVPIR